MKPINRTPAHEDVLQRLIAGEIDIPTAMASLRHCYCPEYRWARWRDGVEAGPDHVLGTGDDIELGND